MQAAKLSFSSRTFSVSAHNSSWIVKMWRSVMRFASVGLWQPNTSIRRTIFR